MDTERTKDNHSDQGLVGDLEEARRMYEEGLNVDLTELFEGLEEETND